jgi:hypothetical protein
MLIRCTAAILIVGCLGVIPASAQRNACQQRSIPVSIDSMDGIPVPPLNSVNFEGSYRNQPVRVTSAVINQEPPRVILLFDASASMHGKRSESEWNLTVDIGEDLVAGMPLASEIGLAFFSAKSVRVTNPTNDRQKLRNELKALRTDSKALVPGTGQTALWDAILESLKMFDHPHLGDAIYVITDGGDNASKATRKYVAETLGEAGVRLFAFTFQNESAGTSAEERVGPANVSQTVDDTGGTTVVYVGGYLGVFPIPQDPALVDKSGKATQLGSLLMLQYGRISNFYRVDINLPETVDKPRKWKLESAGFSKSERDRLMLRYPQLLVPCH